MAGDVVAMAPKSVETDVAIAHQKIDDHIGECARNYSRVDHRLGRLEAGILAAIVGILAVLWQNYSGTHPPAGTALAPPAMVVIPKALR